MQPAIRNYTALFAACLLFHVAGTWTVPLIDRDEPRFAEAAREMRERKEYVIPFFNNEYRFDKPPLTYWWQILSYRVLGENDFAARLPTGVAAALVAVVLFAWGRRLGNDAVGWWAAIVFTLSLQTFIHGKAAVADMWVVLFVTLANRAAFELLPKANQTSNIKYQTSWWWVFYTSLAFGFLAKGPIGWLPLLTVVFVARPYGFGEIASRFRFIRGVIVTLAIVSAWGVPALTRTGGEFFTVGIGKHVIQRSAVPMEGHGAASPLMYVALLPFYLITLFPSFFPWSLKLPALWKAVRARHDATDRFLITGVVVVFVIFTLVQTKLPHYTLPALPLLALLIARRWEDLRLSPRFAAAAAIAYLAIALFLASLVTQFFPSHSLMQVSRSELRSQMEFGAIDFTEPSLVWYFRKYIRGFMTSLKRRDAVDYMEKPGARFLILPSSVAAELFPRRDPAWHSYRVAGFNIAKGRHTDLTLLLKLR